MLPFSWHQGQDPWSNNAATSRAETQQPTQVHPSPAHRTLSGCIHDENVSSAVTIAVLHKTAIVTADQTFSSLFRSRMSISPSISTIPHDLPEGFAFGAGEIVSGPGAPGRKAGPGLQRPLQGARMQPPKPASALPHPPMLLAQVAMRRGQVGQQRERLAGRARRGWGPCQRNGHIVLV